MSLVEYDEATETNPSFNRDLFIVDKILTVIHTLLTKVDKARLCNLDARTIMKPAVKPSTMYCWFNW